MKLVTKQYLALHDSCQYGIDFMMRNGLEGFPLARLDEIEGDYEEFVLWLITRPVCEYDDKGNKVKEIDTDGDISLFEYDSNDNMTKLIYPNGEERLFEYDAYGNKVKETYMDNVYLYEYDDKSHLLVKEYWLDGDSSPEGSISYEYDTAGNKTKEIWNNGDVFQWEYNEVGAVTKLTDSYGDVYITEYDAAGHVTKTVNPNGRWWAYEFDSAGNTIKITNSVTNEIYRIEYDDKGNKIKEGNADDIMSYEYDDKGNMTKSISQKGVATEWSFDHNDDGTFTITKDRVIIMTVPKF